MRIKVVLADPSKPKSKKMKVEGGDTIVLMVKDEGARSASSLAKQIVMGSQKYDQEQFEVNMTALSVDFASRVQVLTNLYLSSPEFSESPTKLVFSPSYDLSYGDTKLRDIFKKYIECMEMTGNNLNPDSFPKIIEEVLKDFGISEEVKMEVTECNEDNFPAIHAVGKGSCFSPKLVVLEFGEVTEGVVNTVLVGKGVTFDTGGLSLKPSNYMDTMFRDMGGSALSFFSALLYYISTKNSVVVVLPIVENAVGSRSYRPGDIINTKSKKTIRVLNTDAEGRVILADAVYHASTQYKYENIIVSATLTGAAKVICGEDYGVFCSDSDNVAKTIMEVANKTGEYMMRVPDDEIFLDALTAKAEGADINNITNGYGAGTITGHKFIQFFAENREGRTYTHFDIANFFDTPAHKGKTTMQLLEFMKELLVSLSNQSNQNKE